MWHITCYKCHVTHDKWHMTCCTWHMTCCGGWIFFKNFSSLALTVLDLWYFKDFEEKAHWLTEWMNQEGVCKTAPATPGPESFFLYQFFFNYPHPPPTAVAALENSYSLLCLIHGFLMYNSCHLEEKNHIFLFLHLFWFVCFLQIMR